MTRRRYVQAELSPTQWHVLHLAAGKSSPLGVRKPNTYTYEVLHRLELIEIRPGFTTWQATKRGLDLIERLAMERVQLAELALTTHRGSGSVRPMAKDIRPGKVSSQMPVTMTGPMHDAITETAEEFGVSRSKVVVDCVDDALARVRRRYGASLLTRSAG